MSLHSDNSNLLYTVVNGETGRFGVRASLGAFLLLDTHLELDEMSGGDREGRRLIRPCSHSPRV